MTTLIDPPSGWKYGFPKFYNNPDDLPVREWLIANGYPQWEVDQWIGNHVRFIYNDETEIERGTK